MTINEFALIPKIDLGLLQPLHQSAAIEAEISDYKGSLLKKIEDVQSRINTSRESASCSDISYQESQRQANQRLHQETLHKKNVLDQLAFLEHNLNNQKQAFSECGQAVASEVQDLLSNLIKLLTIQGSQQQLQNQIEGLFFYEEEMHLAQKMTERQLHNCVAYQASLHPSMEELQMDLYEEALHLESYRQALKDAEESKEEIRQELQSIQPITRLDQLYVQVRQEQWENQKKVDSLKKDWVEVQDRISKLKIAQQEMEAQATTIRYDQNQTHEAHIQMEGILESLEQRSVRLDYDLVTIASHLNQLECKQEEIAQHLQQAEKEQEEKEQLLDQIDQVIECIIWHQDPQTDLIDWEEEPQVVSNFPSNHVAPTLVTQAIAQTQVSHAHAPLMPSTKGAGHPIWKWAKKSLSCIQTIVTTLFRLLIQAAKYAWAQTASLAAYQWTIIQAVYLVGKTAYCGFRENPASFGM